MPDETGAGVRKQPALVFSAGGEQPTGLPCELVWTQACLGGCVVL